jgi:hypothetical protein
MDFGRAHPTGRLSTIGIGLKGHILEPLPLDGPGCLDPLPHGGARFASRRDLLLSFSNGTWAPPRAKRIDPARCSLWAGYRFLEVLDL